MASFPGNWRAGLSLQGRQRIVNEIFQTIRLRMGPEQPSVVLLDLAARCEEMVYASATDLSWCIRHGSSYCIMKGQTSVLLHRFEDFATEGLNLLKESEISMPRIDRLDRYFFNDYVRKIALKLLTVEAHIPARDSAPPLPPSTPPLSPRRTVLHDEEEEEQDFEGGDANIASANVNNNNIKV